MKRTILLMGVLISFLAACNQAEDFDTNLYVESTTVFEGTAPTEWTELDLSNAVGKNYALVTLKVTNQTKERGLVACFRQVGDTADYLLVHTGNLISVGYGGSAQASIYTDEDGVIEWMADNETPAKVEVVAFVK